MAFNLKLKKNQCNETKEIKRTQSQSKYYQQHKKIIKATKQFEER